MTHHSKHTRAYRDDILYLIDMRDSHLTHPKKTVSTNLFTPSMARIFCVTMIGEIEATFNAWREKDENSILEPFWQDSPNKSRIIALEASFIEHEIEVDREILDYYLAIKYVRNIITHSKDPKPASETSPHIIDMGFPLDPRDLTEEHLAIMYRVNKEMIRYITAIEKDEFNESRYNYNTYFDKKNLPETSKYFDERDFRGFLWNNIENMNWKIANTPSLMDKKFLKAAIFSWTSYKNMTLAEIVNFEELQDNIKRLQELLILPNYNEFPRWIIPNSNSPIEKKFITKIEKQFGIPQDQIPLYIQAINQAKSCDNRIKNGSAASLLEKISRVHPIFCGFDFKKESVIANQIFKMLELWKKFK